MVPTFAKNPSSICESYTGNTVELAHGSYFR